MQTLYKPKSYPPEIMKAINKSGALGIALANRWMLGWPERVKSLIQANEYQEAFNYQLEREKDALAAASNNTHLSPTEIMQVYGLSLEPPAV